MSFCVIVIPTRLRLYKQPVFLVVALWFRRLLGAHLYRRELATTRKAAAVERNILTGPGDHDRKAVFTFGFEGCSL